MRGPGVAHRDEPWAEPLAREASATTKALLYKRLALFVQSGYLAVGQSGFSSHPHLITRRDPPRYCSPSGSLPEHRTAAPNHVKDSRGTIFRVEDPKE
jgi:hypothetical protein